MGMVNPLVLLVDDANLVDPQSMALLASMSDSLSRHPILLVVARLSSATSSDADVVLQTNATQRIGLAPLGAPQVVDLVQTMFGGVPNSQRLARWLFAETGGNPGDRMELIDALLRRAIKSSARPTRPASPPQPPLHRPTWMAPR